MWLLSAGVSTSAFAATVIVTQTDDVLANETPIFGSLRDAIKNRASPGDTIVFDVRGPIRLHDVLTIPRHLTGLTFQGQVTIRPSRGFRGVIAVEADNTTFSNVTFQDTSLLVHDVSSGIPRRMSQFRLATSSFRGDSEVFVAEVDDCNITDNKFVVAPESGGEWALNTSRTDNCAVSGNSIVSRTDAAYIDNDSTNLQFVNNKISKGTVRLWPISGDVTDNMMTGRMSVHFPDFGTTNGHLLIEHNEAGSIFVDRTNISIIDNTLTGNVPGGVGPVSGINLTNTDPRGPQGDVRIEENTITGGQNGIVYTGSPTASKAIIHDNVISGCDLRGILVNHATDVQVTENNISMCGTGTTGRGIGIGAAAGTGLIVANNDISRINGDGILVVPQADGIDVALNDNTIQTNAAAGIRLQQNDDLRQGRILMTGNTLTGNTAGGVVAEENARGSISGGMIANNRGPGVLVEAGASLDIRGVQMGDNDGPGIDLAPAGISTNDAVKTGNADIDWPEDVLVNPVTLKLEGMTLPGAVVEVFVVEGGARLGNPDNGEGTNLLGAVTAGADGLFSYPANGELQCPASRWVTLTATLNGAAPVTSEFSPDIDCTIPDEPPGEDDDNDGVVNGNDQCEATPEGAEVDANGCAESQKDDDGDGVANNQDACDLTPQGAAVDANGCAESQKDDDNDGKTNDVDNCPATPDGAAVDENGCAESQKDDDTDGVSNDEDQCKNTEVGAVVDSNGCASTVVIPDFGTVYLNNLDQSTIETGATGESCSDCIFVFIDATMQSCSAGTLVITGVHTVTSTGCSFEAPALTIDGTGAEINNTLNGEATCEGTTGRCTVEANDPGVSGSCTATRCLRSFAPTALADGVETTVISVRKSTVGEDGAFNMSVQSINSSYQHHWTVNTAAGTGDAVAESYIGDESPVTVTEALSPEWTESVSCVNDKTAAIAGGENSVTLLAVPGMSSRWSCTFTNTAVNDSDGDTVPDNIDRCSNAGTNGNECPEQGDNGLVVHYCNSPLLCSFTPTDGHCTDCSIERLDGSAAIDCFGGGTCVMRDNDVLQCPAGGCSYTTPGLSGSCGLGSLCTFDGHFSCQSDTDGNGCDGALTSGDPVGCDGQQCDLNVSTEVLLTNGINASRVDIRKQSVNGSAAFNFRWKYYYHTLTDSGGTFEIQTVGGTGAKIARFYMSEISNSLEVSELKLDPYELQEISCDTTDGLEIRTEGELAPDVEGELLADRNNTCTFVNVRPDATPSRNETIPDGQIGPEGVTNVAPDSFGGQLNTSNPVVGIGTGSSEIFIDVVTGEVPRAGSDRLSFSGTGFPSIGVVVQPDEDEPGFDTIHSVGPGTVSYGFNPNTGTFGFGVLGFDNIIDLVHLGNDTSKEALLSVNRTRNRIDIWSPPDSTGIGFLNFFTVIESQNLQDASGQVISAQAYELGRLDCNNPCETTGAPMPSGCSSEIDQVLTTPGLEFCNDSWGSFCVFEYSSQNNNFCSLPAADRQVSFGGNVLVLTDGSPGQIHLANPVLNFFGRVDTIGNVGNDPRRVRCLAGICAVTNYASNSLTILTWDGGDNAAITATVPVGIGPIGADLRQSGSEIVILSTGSGDNTYSKTTIAADGSLVGNETLPIIEGCEAPGHIIWVTGTAQAVATCFDSNSYAVFEP